MKRIKATSFGLVLMTMANLAAKAQTGTVNSVTDVPGLDLQAGVTMNVAQVKDDLLAGTEKFAQGASKVTEINLNPSTMGMVGRTYGPDGDMTKKMKLMVVHTYQYDKPGMFRMEDVEAYTKKLEDGSWNCPIVSREKEKDQEKLSYICTKTDSDQTNEMVVLTAEPQRLTFIHMAGTMSLNDLTHMSDSAHGLSRSVEPHGSYYFPSIQPKVLVIPSPPKSPSVNVTPATPALPALPPQ